VSRLAYEEESLSFFMIKSCFFASIIKKSPSERQKMAPFLTGWMKGIVKY